MRVRQFHRETLYIPSSCERLHVTLMFFFCGVPVVERWALLSAFPVIDNMSCVAIKLQSFYTVTIFLNFKDHFM